MTVVARVLTKHTALNCAHFIMLIVDMRFLIRILISSVILSNHINYPSDSRSAQF